MHKVYASILKRHYAFLQSIRVQRLVGCRVVQGLGGCLTSRFDGESIHGHALTLRLAMWRCRVRYGGIDILVPGLSS